MVKITIENGILHGENNSNYGIPEEPLGKYFLKCLRGRKYDDIISVDAVTEEILTCGRLIQESVKLAIALKQLGVQQNDVVVLVSKNNINFNIILLATLSIGAILNPLNCAYSIWELKHAFHLTRPKIVISSTECTENILQIVPETTSVQHIIIFGETTTDDSVIKNFDHLVQSVPDNEVENFQPAEFDISKQGAVILLSSGTTGLPKGVLLSHLTVQQMIGYMQDQTYFNSSHTSTIQVVPNCHIFGFIVQCLAIFASVKIILLSKFSPTVYLSSIQKYKISKVYAVPSLMLFLVKSPLVKDYDLSSLNAFFVGAAPLGQELQEEAQQHFKDVPITEFYGSTEIGGAGFVHPSGCIKSGSVGIPIPGISVKIAELETNRPLEARKVGEVCFKGRQSMLGYYGNEEATSESIDADGFYHSGDLGYYDEDGYIFIVDRIKELIKYKGFQVSPTELESIIIVHPGISDCAVIGIPDSKAGELPLAFVVKNDETIKEDDIKKIISDKLSINKHLHGGVRFIKEIPRNTNGKIMRKVLQDLAKTL